MNDFDRYLESELRQMLDRVVDAAAPSRRTWQKHSRLPLVAVVKAPIEKMAEVLPVIDPVATGLITLVCRHGPSFLWRGWAFDRPASRVGQLIFPGGNRYLVP